MTRAQAIEEVARSVLESVELLRGRAGQPGANSTLLGVIDGFLLGSHEKARAALGPVGDGVTDDTAALQAMIDAAQPEDGGKGR